jgi:hypothetical protein
MEIKQSCLFLYVVLVLGFFGGGLFFAVFFFFPVNGGVCQGQCYLHAISAIIRNHKIS